MWSMDWGLVGDVGATNARFALLKPGGGLTPARTYLCDDYPTIGEALAAYLAASDGGQPSQAVLAIAAAPVRGAPTAKASARRGCRAP